MATDYEVSLSSANHGLDDVLKTNHNPLMALF